MISVSGHLEPDMWAGLAEDVALWGGSEMGRQGVSFQTPPRCSFSPMNDHKIDNFFKTREGEI